MTGSPDFAPVVAPGDVLAGKYRVERVIGIGGMGVVVAAHHMQLEERVALKFLLPQALGNPEAVARFVREARAAVKIKGEHVARVSDVGQLDNGSPYIVMEYLEGIDLSAWLKQRGPLPIELAVDFVLQTCEAIADAHALGIIHRDLKPANLFCVQRSDGQLSIKVLDFGISKFTAPGTSGHDMTRTTALVGSPYYMSPEQLQSSKGVDARTDLWSLGIILFELLSGRIPFDAEAVTELAIKIAVDPAPPLSTVRADAPAGLVRAVSRCLEKDRARRFQTVGELAKALEDFGPPQSRASVQRVLGTLRQAGISAGVGPPPGALQASAPAVASQAPQTGASWGHTGAGPRSGGKAIAAIAIVLTLGVIATGAAIVLRNPRASDAAPAAAASMSTPAATATLLATARLAPPMETAVTATTSAPASPVASSPPPASRIANPMAVRPAVTAAGGAQPTAAAAAARSAVPAAKPNCAPPYVIDSAGDRQYKPECL